MCICAMRVYTRYQYQCRDRRGQGQVSTLQYSHVQTGLWKRTDRVASSTNNLLDQGRRSGSRNKESEHEGILTETRKYLYGFRNVSRISISLSAQLLSPDPAVYCTQHCTAEHCTHHQTSISVVLLGFSQPPRPGSTAHSSQYQHQPAALQHTLQ